MCNRLTSHNHFRPGTFTPNSHGLSLSALTLLPSLAGRRSSPRLTHNVFASLSKPSLESKVFFYSEDFPNTSTPKALYISALHKFLNLSSSSCPLHPHPRILSMDSETTLSTVNEGLLQTPLIPAVERFKYSNRVLLKSILGRADGGIGLAGERLLVGGWVKSSEEKQKKEASLPLPPSPQVVKDATCSEILISRLPILRSIVKILTGAGCTVLYPGKLDGPTKPAPAVAYLCINDGSCVFNLQVIVASFIHPLSQILPVGTSVLVEGTVERTKVAGKHAVELRVEKVLHVGSVDAKKYPLSKRTLSMAFLRAYPHLCPRRTPVASVARIRNSLSHSAHQFFLSNGFINVHMPIITTTTTTNSRAQDKMFGVASTSNEAYNNLRNVQEAKNLEVIKTAIMKKNERIEELKRSNSNKESLLVALQDLQKANDLALQLEHQHSSTSTKIKEIFSENLFGQESCLSSYVQLQLESYACSLSCVYSFGPIFQAENTLPSKCLAESWKIEVELAFAELKDAMNCAEDFLMYLCHSILEHCSHDLQFMYKRVDSKCVERIKSMGSNPFARISYTEAVEIIKKEALKKFEDKIEWGMNLSREHESFLADAVYQRPVIIYDYPKELKPFFLRIRDDAKTISAFDIIAPKAGRLVQGGQKEERLEKISESMRKLGLAEEEYEWYLDLRRYGTVKHSGFSAGLEEIVMFVTGLDDIRDSIPFPRNISSTVI